MRPSSPLPSGTMRMSSSSPPAACPTSTGSKGAEHCTGVRDILSGAASAGPDTIVYDGTGRHAALTAAEAIARKGGEVAFFALNGHLAMEMALFRAGHLAPAHL